MKLSIKTIINIVNAVFVILCLFGLGMYRLTGNIEWIIGCAAVCAVFIFPALLKLWGQL